MSLIEIGAIGEFVAAIAVLITLIYLSLQVRQGNAQSRLEVRRIMFEYDHRELYRLVDDPMIWDCFVKEEPLSKEEKTKFVFWLTANMRLREWEWEQQKAGYVSEADLAAYDEVTLQHLGNSKALKWWETLGKPLYSPEFVGHVDRLLEENTPSDDFYREFQQLVL